MRQGNWRVAAVGLLAVSLLCSPVFAGGDGASDQPFKDVRSKVITEHRDSGDLVPFWKDVPIGPFLPEPSGLADKYDLVWDNGFAGEAGGIIQANQCEALSCSSPIGYLASDIQLPPGTIVNGFKTRTAFRNPAILGNIIGAVFTIWPDCNDSGPCPTGVTPSAGVPNAPGNAGTDPAPGWLYRFTVASTDPGFRLFNEGPAERRIEVEFNPGDFWVADGGIYWVSMTSVSQFPPQTFDYMSLFPIEPPSWQSFNPVEGNRPWGDDPDPYPGELIYDHQFQLYGERPIGGTKVVTLSGTGSGVVTVRASQGSHSSCTSGDCISDCPACGAAVDVTGLSASAAASAIAAAFPVSCACTDGNVTATSAGPYLIIRTDDGPKPSVCVNTALVGGPANCTQTEANLDMQVGLQPDQTLDEIPPGIDWLGTTKDPSCTTADGQGTWATLAELGGVTAGGGSTIYDRPGLPATDAVGDRRVALKGSARDFGNEDTDTTVERLEPIIFGLCSGDFIDAGNGGSTASNPDGLVDADDAASFAACLGNYGTGDCYLFDFDNDGDVDAPGDQDVFNCLLASDDNVECCPENLNLPQTVVIGTELRRLHLRSCSPIEVTRGGLTKGLEWWWIDHYISGVPAGTTSEVLATPCNQQDNEPNNIAANAEPLGFLGRANPIRVWGSISSPACDGLNPPGTQPGQSDADLYKFRVAFTDLVSFRVRARGTAGACVGDCACNDANLAVPSLYIFDETGSSLLASNTPPIDPLEQEPILTPTTDPAVSVVLAPGTYIALVASANQINVPDPTHATCSVNGGEPYDGYGPTTGDFELNMAIVDRSTMWVTQTNDYGGTFDSKLLVQSLVIFSRNSDPDSVTVIDTGELGELALNMYANDESWANNNALPETEVYVTGREDFIPGISADASNNQAVDPIQHVNVNVIDGADPTTATVAHLVQPPKKRGCFIIEDGCAYIQGPNDVDADAIGAARGTATDFPAADDFTLAATTTINSVTFWLVGATDTDADDVFDIIFHEDGAFGNCTSGPATVAASYTGLMPEVIRTTRLNDADRVTFNLDPGFEATGGQKYWLEVVQDLVEGPGQVFFMLSDTGDGSMFRDLDPLDPITNGTGSATNCPDWSLEGDGWDCDAYVDDEAGASSECDEAACGNGDADCVGTDYPGDLFNANLAFCLGTGTVEAWTKDLPTDVASGNWHTRPGDILWNQPMFLNGGNLNDASDRRMPSNNDLGQQSADDFTFFAETTITDIHWRGRYDTNTPELRIPLGDQFHIEFWDDDNGLPGALVYEYVAPQPVVRTPARLTGDPGWQAYDYYLDISGDPFVAAANTTYWMSIINDSTGSAHYWFWLRSDGGEANGTSALRDIGDPWGGAGWDKSFDLTGGTFLDKIVSVKSVDCDAIQATGLGYTFDATHAYINGYQTKQGDAEAQENRWAMVRAPWKFFADLKSPFPADPTGAANAIAALIAAYPDYDIVAPTNPECLIGPEYVGKTIENVFAGRAAYDIVLDYYGIEVGGRIYRECNGEVIETSFDPSDILSPEDEPLGTRERLDVIGFMFDNQVATAQIGTSNGPECFDDFDCTQCNVCFRPACIDGACVQTPVIYGDVNNDGTVSIFDLFCILNGFGGDYSVCSFLNDDIAPCAGDGTISIFDLFGVLNAFGGTDPCCNCSPTAPTLPCTYGTPPACPAPAADSPADLSVSGRTGRDGVAANLKLVPSQRTAHAGDLIDVDVYVTGVTNLRGYELGVAVDGGRRGNLDLVSVSIDERRDYVLNAVENARAVDDRGRLAGAAYVGGVSAAGSAYLGTFTFEVSSDAVGAFRVGLQGGDHTLLLDPNGEEINIGRITPGMVLVSTPARGQ